MHTVRIPLAVVVGGAFTTAMFYLLWSLVSTSFEGERPAEATMIEFTRIVPDTEVVTKRAEKVERERPPPTPETPRIALTSGGVERTVARLTPIVDTNGTTRRDAARRS